MFLKVIYALMLFTIETIIQSFYYSVSVKYFEQFSKHDTVGEIFKDAIEALFMVKSIFFLPVYIIFYLVADFDTSATKKSLFHGIMFFVLFMVVTILLPGEIAKRIIDTFVLTVIAFGSSACSIFLSRSWGIKRKSIKW